MSFVNHERPGVYAEYDVTHIGSGMGGSKVVGLIGVSPLQQGAYTFTDANSVLRRRDSSQLGKLLRIAYANGARKVIAYAIEADNINMYRPAIQQLLEEDKVDYLVLGSALEDVQLYAKQTILERKAECICFVGMADASMQAVLNRAAKLNFERMVLVGQDVVLQDETDLAGGCYAAAALAAQLVQQSDPAAPFYGVCLEGISDTNWYLDDDAIDTLVHGGVTVLEAAGGKVNVLRSITTKTKNADGDADTALRELNTMLIIDEMIPHLRSVLRQNFLRSKNNAATRAAIFHRMVLELEEYERREIIDSYQNLRVTASDATICVVEFGFAVTHGIGRIYLTAHITV